MKIHIASLALMAMIAVSGPAAAAEDAGAAEDAAMAEDIAAAEAGDGTLATPEQAAMIRFFDCDTSLAD